MTDSNDQFDKIKKQAKDTANEIGTQAKEQYAKYAPQAKEAADKLGAEAKAQYEKLSPKAKEAAAKAKAHPKFKLIAGAVGALVVVVLIVALLPSGPSNSDVEKALRTAMIDQAKQLNGFVNYFGGNREANDSKIEDSINTLDIDVEILDKKESGKNSWLVHANVVIEDGDKYDEDEHTFGMHKTKKAWQITSGL